MTDDQFTLRKDWLSVLLLQGDVLDELDLPYHIGVLLDLHLDVLRVVRVKCVTFRSLLIVYEDLYSLAQQILEV